MTTFPCNRTSFFHISIFDQIHGSSKTFQKLTALQRYKIFFYWYATRESTAKGNELKQSIVIGRAQNTPFCQFFFSSARGYVTGRDVLCVNEGCWFGGIKDKLQFGLGVDLDDIIIELSSQEVLISSDFTRDLSSKMSLGRVVLGAGILVTQLLLETLNFLI